MDEQIAVTANVDVYAVEVDGSRTLVGQGRNLVVNSGLSTLPEMLLGNTTQVFKYTQVSTGATKVELTDTALDDQQNAVRGEIRIGDARATGNAVSMDTFFVSADISLHIREAGLWTGDVTTTDLSPGTLFARTLLNIDNSVARKDLVLAWRIRFASP